MKHSGAQISRLSGGPRGAALAAGLLGLILLGWAGAINLGSLAWSHALLAGLRPANFPDVVLRDSLAAGGPAGRGALGAGVPNPLAPAEPGRQRAMVAATADGPDAALADFAAALAQADAGGRQMAYESLIAYGETAAAAGQADQAGRAFDLAIRAVPQQAAAYVRRGELQHAAQQYPAAIATFQQAVAVADPTANAGVERAHAYYTMGLLYGALGDAAAARTAYQRAVAADPANTGWWWTWNAEIALSEDAGARAAWPEAASWLRQAQAVAINADQLAIAQDRLQHLGH